jgi:RNA polymerase sigma factor (TIGR02999 family)
MHTALKKHEGDSATTRTIEDIFGNKEMCGAEMTAALIPFIYDELRRIAAYRLAQEKPEQALEPAELVDEAYLRLVRDSDAHWENMHHFFVAAAEAMRRILIENARKKKCLKRGGDWYQIDIDLNNIRDNGLTDDMVQMHELVGRLAEIDPESAKLVKLRFFIGLSQQRCADVLGISKRTADKRWAFARAWLSRALHTEE